MGSGPSRSPSAVPGQCSTSAALSPVNQSYSARMWVNPLNMKSDRRYFLPHERWLVKKLQERRMSRPTLTVIRLNAKYGPDGLMLLWAALASTVPGSGMTVFGIMLLAISRGSRSVAPVALVLMAVGALVILWGWVRLLQSAKAGRAFRASLSPFRQVNL
jgi:hypothetical protein